MVQHNNALRTHLILNHKAKGLPGRSFAFRSPKGWGIYDVFKQNEKGSGISWAPFEKHNGTI